ncbi:MAG: hypothetical protein K6A40_04990 [Solobacterium sp.]|nr:hypothetical protein [Solobacterium sp.]
MKKACTLFLALIFAVQLTACSAGIPSLFKAVHKGAEWTEHRIAEYTREEIIEEWGQPAETDAEKLTWRSEEGRVTLSFRDGHAHVDEIVSYAVAADYPWPLSLIPRHSAFRILAAMIYVSVPFILLFLLVSIGMRKMGWGGSGDRVREEMKDKTWFSAGDEDVKRKNFRS